MTTFANVAPTQGDQGNSFEWLWDINIGTAQAPVWVNIPDIKGLTPNATPDMKDGSTYANKGSKSQSKAGEDFTLGVQVKGVKDLTGEFQSYVIALIEAADTTGGANVIGYRYYHATSAALAYEGTASVNWSRVNTDVADIEFFSFDLSGQGDRHKIVNPGVTGGKPSISSVQPTGAVAGDTVVVTGARFTGTTTVTMGGVAVTTESVISDSLLAIVVPAGTAGAAPVIVTNDVGASAAFTFIRGA